MAKDQIRMDPKVDAAPAAAEFDGGRYSLERIAVALERIADRFAPPETTIRSIPGTLARKTCPVGHGMQPTDDYCQACARERRNPKPATGNDAA